MLDAELARYDHWLVVAAHMLEWTPEAFPGPGRPVAPEIRALLEDPPVPGRSERLRRPHGRHHYDVLGDDDPVF